MALIVNSPGPRESAAERRRRRQLLQADEVVVEARAAAARRAPRPAPSARRRRARAPAACARRCRRAGAARAGRRSSAAARRSAAARSCPPAGGAGCDGIRSKYFSIFSSTSPVLTSPTIGEHGIVRRVVRLEERLHVGDVRGAEVGHRADHRMLVGGVLVGQLVDRFEGLAVRLVVDAEAPLFLDGVALVVEVLLVIRATTCDRLRETAPRSS